MEMDIDEPLESVVSELQGKMNEEDSFAEAVAALTAIVREKYPSASTFEQITIYSAVCEAAELLQTQYTARGLWVLGLELFNEALQVVVRPDEKNEIGAFITKTQDFLGEEETRQDVPAEEQAGTSAVAQCTSLISVEICCLTWSNCCCWVSHCYAGSYTTYAGSAGIVFLYSGQLTPEELPTRPLWLFTHIADIREASRRVEEQTGQTHLEAAITGAWQRMEEQLGEEQLEAVMAATLQEAENAPHGPPPASVEEVAKLPVVPVTEELLMQVGDVCVVCREMLASGDPMQEMPCKHFFHPPCLKLWLDQHNSCPVCRYELRTDDPEYEAKKEREKQEAVDRNGV